MDRGNKQGEKPYIFEKPLKNWCGRWQAKNICVFACQVMLYLNFFILVAKKSRDYGNQALWIGAINKGKSLTFYAKKWFNKVKRQTFLKN